MPVAAEGGSLLPPRRMAPERPRDFREVTGSVSVTVGGDCVVRDRKRVAGSFRTCDLGAVCGPPRTVHSHQPAPVSCSRRVIAGGRHVTRGATTPTDPVPKQRPLAAQLPV